MPNTRFNTDICFVTKVAWTVAYGSLLVQLSRQLCLTLRVDKAANAG